MAQTKLYTKVSNESEDEEDNIEPKSLRVHKSHSAPNGILSLLINPKFIIFTLCLLASIIFIFYWFINEDIAFNICGIIGLLMSIFGMFVFRMSLNYKQEMHLYKSLNRAVKMDYKRCNAQIDRTREAIKILQETKQRLIKNNATNKDNYKIFEKMTELIQQNGNNDTYNNSVSMAKIWKKQNIENVKQILLKVYDRFVDDIIGDDGNTTIIKQEQITEFEQMLPTHKGSDQDESDNKSVNDEIEDKTDEKTNDTNLFKKNDGQIAMDYNNDEKALESGVLISPQTKSESQLSSTPFIVVNNESKNHKNNVKEKTGTETRVGDKKLMEINSNNETNLSIFDEEEYQQSPKKPSPIITVDCIDSEKASGTNNDEEKRKVGKLKHNWGQTPKDEKGRYTPKNKKLKKDESWVKHKIAKPIHPVHESIDALQIDKLVTKAQIVKKLSVTNEDEEDDESQFQFNLPKQKSKTGKIKRKKSRESPRVVTPGKTVNPDDSWVKHKIEKIHPVHESVDALEINRLVSKANIMDVLNNVEPIGEEQDTDVDQNDPILNKRKSKKTDE